MPLAMSLLEAYAGTLGSGGSVRRRRLPPPPTPLLPSPSASSSSHSEPQYDDPVPPSSITERRTVSLPLLSVSPPLPVRPRRAGATLFDATATDVAAPFGGDFRFFPRIREARSKTWPIMAETDAEDEERRPLALSSPSP